MISEGAKSNVSSWKSIYEEGTFGNKYPSSYLVSLIFRLIKDKLPMDNQTVRVLDFGCSFGANAKMLRDLGFEVYGIDISDIAVKHCIEKCGFDKNHFKAINLLEVDDVKTIFGIEFDLIIASECLYYFSQRDLNRLFDKFNQMMTDKAVIYGNMQTFNYGFYKGCKEKGPNEDGMYRIETSGAADKPLYVNLVEGKDDTRKIFECFDVLYVLRHLEEVDDEYETIHCIARKRK